MNKDEALKLALGALESGEYYIDDLEAIVYAADDLGTHEDRAKMQEAITAIKQALAAPVQEPVAWMFPDDLKRFETSEAYAEAYSIKMGSPTQGTTIPLYTTPPAQPAPVQEKWGLSAVMNPDYVAAQKEKAQQALDVMAQNARELGLDYEPVPENFIDALKFDVAMRDAAQRQWVGLTDEEIHTEWALTPQGDSEGLWLGRRVEAKLKEKNT